MSKDVFKFRKHDSIGAADAEDDREFLMECFVETGDLEAIKDCKNPRKILLGRTGSGKTALLSCLAFRKKVIVIEPQSLSLNYIANSNILQFFHNLGVKLDLFFKLLWRHIFAVELLKRKYDIKNDRTADSFLNSIRNILIRDKNKERAIKYLKEWGEKFWETTDYQIKERTTKVEDELKNCIGTKLGPITGDFSDSAKLSTEEKSEIKQRAQNVINSIQMKVLGDILDFLDNDVFNDPKDNYYIAIDRLDENWVDDKFKYLLIRNLIETIREFGKVENVKIIIALRNDLLERVFRETRDPGFQEEKYRSLYLELRWNKKQLAELLNKRVNFLVRRRYTKQKVGYKDVLPRNIDGKPTLDYMIERTLRRPRELIEFFNQCIIEAEDKPQINKKMLKSAEFTYSKNRLRSLQDEWGADFPNLIDFSVILKEMPFRFRFEDINIKLLEEFCLNFSSSHVPGVDELSRKAREVAEGKLESIEFLRYLLYIFYRTGIIGLKTETYEKFQWQYNGPPIIPSSTISNKSHISIHPMFWRIFGTLNA
jgi:hypothetical protein